MERISIGFAAGQVVSARVSKEELDALSAALSSTEPWHQLTTEDGVVNVRTESIVYLRTENPESKVGFGL